MSHSHYAAEKAILTSHARIIFAAPHNTRHAPLYSPDLLSFTIYPTSQSDIAQNEFLWHAVNDSSFTLSAGRRLVSRRLPISHPHLAGTPATLFGIALPEPLAQFLETVSLSEMHRSVVYMLADAAQAEDDIGLRFMRSTLAPNVWVALRKFIRSTRPFRNGVQCTSASFMLDTALQTAYEHDYWSIDVEGAIFLPKRHIAFNCISNDARAAAVLASLYQDWATYTANELIWEVSLPEDAPTDSSRASARRKVALETMMRLVRQGRQTEMWQRVDALRQCAQNQSSLFGKLPFQVVEHFLVPRIVLDSDDCVSQRHSEMVAQLKRDIAKEHAAMQAAHTESLSSA